MRSYLEQKLDEILVGKLGFMKGIVPDQNEDPDFWYDLICRYIFKFNQFLFRVDFKNSGDIEIYCRTIPDEFNKVFRWRWIIGSREFYQERDCKHLDIRIKCVMKKFIESYYQKFLFKDEDVCGEYALEGNV